MSNTIDLRGIEQSVSRKDTEAYAATYGYEFMLFGSSNEPQDIDPSVKPFDGKVHAHFWSSQEHKLYVETGHVLKYPSRQHCANCGEAMFTKHSSNCRGY